MSYTVIIYTLMSLLIPWALMYKGNYKRKIIDGGVIVTINWSLFLVLAFVVTVLVKGLAYDTQGDWMYYYNHLKLTSEGLFFPWGEHTEIGYRTLVHLLAFLNMPISTFFILCAVLWYYSLLKLSFRFINAAPIIMLLTTALLFCSSLNILRQYMAMSFLLLGLNEYLDKKYIKTTILFIVSVLFHSVAAVFPLGVIFAMLCIRYKISKYILIVMVVVTTVLGMGMLTSFIERANQIMSLFSSFNSHATGIDNMLEREWEQNFVWLKAFFAIITIYLGDNLKNKYRDYPVVFYIGVFYYIISPFCQQLELMRISMLWMMLLPYVWGMILYHFFQSRSVLKLVVFSPVVIFEIVRYFDRLTSIADSHPYIIKFL
ncbi:MAG: EpsG family protein [Paludibacteraceae bacterium]|nr:EpsG family protein [Paludibacteraceae bacterium]